jgi:hypothetical protein
MFSVIVNYRYFNIVYKTGIGLLLYFILTKYCFLHDTYLTVMITFFILFYIFIEKYYNF